MHWFNEDKRSAERGSALREPLQLRRVQRQRNPASPDLAAELLTEQETRAAAATAAKGASPSPTRQVQMNTATLSSDAR